jgi:hypothetical protein
MFLVKIIEVFRIFAVLKTQSYMRSLAFQRFLSIDSKVLLSNPIPYRFFPMMQLDKWCKLLIGYFTKNGVTDGVGWHLFQVSANFSQKGGDKPG